MSELQIKYIEMPISREDKKKYHREGFRVVDARFKPAEVEPEVEVDETPAKRKARRAAEREAKKNTEEQE